MPGNDRAWSTCWAWRGSEASTSTCPPAAPCGYRSIPCCPAPTSCTATIGGRQERGGDEPFVPPAPGRPAPGRPAPGPSALEPRCPETEVVSVAQRVGILLEKRTLQ